MKDRAGLIVDRWPSFGEPPLDLHGWHGALRDDIPGEPAWYGLANPSDAQRKPSCAGHAAANVIEVLLRRDVPEKELHAAIESKLGHLRWQFDGERLWREARRRWHGGTEDGGLRMEDVARFPEILGAPLRSERVDKSGRSMALEIGPIVIGLATWPAWKRPDPSSGYIRAEMPDPWSGHAVALMARAKQTGWYDVFLNSWGESWGRYGYGMLNAAITSYAWLDDGVLFIPTGADWWRGWNWIDWVAEHTP